MENLVQKIATVCLSWKLVLRYNSNLKNLIVMFIFFCFWPEIYFFWTFVPIINISWGWNLEYRLIWICRIQWNFSFFVVQKYPFCVNMIQNSFICFSAYINTFFTGTNSSLLIYELIKALEIRISIVFNLAFPSNTISLCFFLFFLIIELNFNSCSDCKIF